MKTTDQTSSGQKNAVKLTQPTIPLSVAIQRAANWRKLVSAIPSGQSAAKGDGSLNSPAIPQQLIFRAINISMADIDALRQQHPDASSIRLYLSLPVAEYQFQICGMLVPVDAQNKDLLTLASNENVTQDEMLNDASNSTVYDFTQPCPTMCDTGSALFNENNSADPYFRYKK